MKKYILIMQENNGVLKVNSKSKGITSFELYGWLAWKLKDIENQIAGNIQPDIITRKIIEDEEA